jgi:hypothetical protein
MVESNFDRQKKTAMGSLKKLYAEEIDKSDEQHQSFKTRQA